MLCLNTDNQETWAVPYIILHSNPHMKGAANVLITRQLTYTTQLYKVPADNVVVTRRDIQDNYSKETSLPCVAWGISPP